MKDKYYVSILSKMYTYKTDAYNEHLRAANFEFYDFWNKNEITKEDYEKMILALRQSGYIDIKPKSIYSYDGAIIKITAEGVIYAN